MDKLRKGETSSHLSRYSIDEKGWLRRDIRLCVPQIGSLIKAVLEEAHHFKMTIHPGGDKMYRNMKRVSFWDGMKKDVA
ncbi:integrase zinc binding domain-containing protein, partial [Staphylococcus aureus]|nr:integrase zinc binding domain-containing protein [Staphylococcus aureus]